jgi:pyrroloquinoline quinone biosynthesis protein B
LHPREGLRSSPIAGVVVTGGDVDAIAGLLNLRERHRFAVYAPTRVLEIVAANPIFDVLAPDCVQRIELPLDERKELAGASGASGLAVVAFAVPGKVPLYLEAAGQHPRMSEEGDAVGVEVIETATEKSFFSSPAARR